MGNDIDEIFRWRRRRRKIHQMGRKVSHFLMGIAIFYLGFEADWIALAYGAWVLWVIGDIAYINEMQSYGEERDAALRVAFDKKRKR